jgi:Family of unknown function (DUF5522)
MQQICSACKAPMSCNVENIVNCWCNDYPPILEVTDDDSCKCKDCLHASVIKKTIAISNEMTVTEALEKNWIKDLPKIKNVIEGIDYNLENGFYVFTKWFHLKRGYCCKNNCRNCGYGYKGLQ